MDKRFEDMFNFFYILAGIFTSLVVVVIGFAYWDRRTMIRGAKREAIPLLLTTSSHHPPTTHQGQESFLLLGRPRTGRFAYRIDRASGNQGSRGGLRGGEDGGYCAG